MLTLALYGLYLLVFSMTAQTAVIINSTINTQFRSCLPQLGGVPTSTYEDCIRAILLWGNTPGRNKPTTFSRDAHAGYQVPQEVSYKDCVFKVDVINAAAKGVWSVANVAREAGVLAKECVLNSAHTGGVSWVGPGEKIEIILRGPTDLATRPSIADSR